MPRPTASRSSASRPTARRPIELATGGDPLEVRRLMSGTAAEVTLLDAPQSATQNDPASTSVVAAESWTLDGSGNNPDRPELGATDTPLSRLSDAVTFGDGLPDPHTISEVVGVQQTEQLSRQGRTHMLWLWSQFVVHDISLTDLETDDLGEGTEADGGDGNLVNESELADEPNTATNPPITEEPDGSLNRTTTFLDGSVIYGTDLDVLRRLRSGERGQLRLNDYLSTTLPQMPAANRSPSDGPGGGHLSTGSTSPPATSMATTATTSPPATQPAASGSSRGATEPPSPTLCLAGGRPMCRGNRCRQSTSTATETTT